MKEESYQGGLSSRSEMILQRYHDADRSLLVSLAARYLLKSKKEAALYLKSLEEQGVLLRMWAQEQSAHVQCWEGIERRIAQEERAQVYLGERPAVASRDRNYFSPFAWSLSGAVVSAMFVFGIMSSLAPTNDGIPSLPSAGVQQVATRTNPELANIPVVARGSEPNLPVRLVGSSPRSSEVEVDWLMSDGSVRMIQGARRGEVPIIWIKRQRSIPGRPSGEGTSRVPRAVVVGGSR